MQFGVETKVFTCLQSITRPKVKGIKVWGLVRVLHRHVLSSYNYFN